MVDRQIVNKAIVWVLIACLVVAAFFLLRPILLAIMVGVFFAYIIHPLYDYVRKYVKEDNSATVIFIIILLAIIAIPLWFFLPILAKEIFNTYLYVQNADLAGAISKVVSLLFGTEIATTLGVQIKVYLAKFFSFSFDSVTAYLSNLPNIILQLSVFVFTFYFAVRDGTKIKAYMSELSPLSKSTEEKFETEFRNITNSIVFGQVITGIIQGLALGLGLWALGVPRVIFLTVIAIILSIIPIIGAWLVWVPVSLFLIASGNVVGGAILFFYGLLFVSTIDNLIRPYLISRHSNLNIFVTIIGTIGGLYTFGLIGLIIGPLIMSYLLIVIEFYRQGKLNELFKE
jgi:predicted PurR-regulated permease PerM